jgi:hypothetical protein
LIASNSAGGLQATFQLCSRPDQYSRPIVQTITTSRSKLASSLIVWHELVAELDKNAGEPEEADVKDGVM